MILESLSLLAIRAPRCIVCGKREAVPFGNGRCQACLDAGK